MKPLSRETQTLIQSLYPENRSWLKPLRTSRKDYKEVLESIAVSGEAIAIVQLAPLLFTNMATKRETLAKTIKLLLKTLSQEDFVHLDKRMRSSYYTALRIEAEQLDSIDLNSEDSWIMLAMSSMAQSGYTREKSTLLLKNTSKEEVLPFLLLRANDWVDEVRLAAYKSLETFLRVEQAEYLVSNLYLISRLERGRAHDDGEIRRSCIDVLQKEECRLALKKGFSHSDRFIRRTCLQLYLESSTENALETIKEKMHDEDVMIRFYASKKLSTLPKDDAALELSKEMLLDSFMPVRRIALSNLQSYPYARYRDLLHEALSNRSISLRKTCRNLIEEHETVPLSYFVEHYQHKLQSNKAQYLEGSLLGLSETGDISHCEVIEPYLSNEHARVRKTSIRALFKLDAKAYRDTFYHCLINDHGCVSKEAARALFHSKAYLDPDDLLKLFHEAARKEKKLLLLWLIHHSLNKWDRLTTLLLAATCSDEAVFSRCSLYLETWTQQFNRGNTSTSIENRTRAREALKKVSHKLNPGFKEMLYFYISER